MGSGCSWDEVAFARRKVALQRCKSCVALTVNAQDLWQQASRVRRSHMEAPSNCLAFVTKADRTPGEGLTYTLPSRFPPDAMPREMRDE